MAAEATKTNKLTVKIDDDEARMLAQLAERSGVSMSQVVRTMIREKHRAEMGPKPGRTAPLSTLALEAKRGRKA
jgi:predicted transcriptional regulator